ncbi:hypothetical protein KPL76_05795 [Subtercola sp. PAMC28395]|uniref:hypothetical protein n=1 Tax=Subtercola sp. PAMC28395 TaxID=2846775 RepID=UPI001C0DD877|nr:hypothetical protein [Subtercola sp. PAMC28395]QWT24870.1 hypothetical protein KPL76_05795 [Subtercola sp. PAMC28395]
MDNHSASQIDIDSAEIAPKKSGLTRRQVATGAAWAVPVIALAVGTPLASASVTSPTATVTGTITGSVGNGVRTVKYSNGGVSYDSAGDPTLPDSGILTIKLAWDNSAYVITYDSVPSGWVLVSASSTVSVVQYEHAPISNGASITFPTVTWKALSTSGHVNFSVQVESDNQNIGSAGVTKGY